MNERDGGTVILRADRLPAAPTLRQYYAAKAMQGMLANNTYFLTDDVPRLAFEIADAMLAHEAEGREK